MIFLVSKDGLNFHELMTLEGAGNTNLTMNYSAVDTNPFYGFSYYRLKQTDYDGQFEYSLVVVVKNDDLASEQIKIYPNPGKSEISIEGNRLELTEFKLYNVYGQDVSESIRVVNQNNATLKVDISKLADGVYTLKTRNYVQKIIKQ